MPILEEQVCKYNEIADMFIGSLLKMNHVSPCMKLNNKFHELILFTYKDSNFTTLPNNRFYMKNDRKSFKTLFPELSTFYCDVYMRPSTKLHTIEIKCDNKWYKFLKEILKAPRSDDGKYCCDILCPELFELIVGKLESLNYKLDEYVKMEQEYRELNTIVAELPNKKKEIDSKLKTLRDQIDKTDEFTLQLITIQDTMERHQELRTTIVSDNIKKVRNIKAFIDAVKKTDDYARIIDSKTIIASAPPQTIFVGGVITHAYGEPTINVNITNTTNLPLYASNAVALL